MVACLEKSERNADFHEIVEFLTASSVHYALTVSPTIYASYIEQFWNTAHSQTVNDVKQIHATVDGKTLVISELSMRSDLYFNYEDAPSTTQPIIEEQITVTESSSPQNTQSPRQALQEDTQLPQTSMPIPMKKISLSFKEIGSGDRPRCQEAMRGGIAQTSGIKHKEQCYEQGIKENLDYLEAKPTKP
ncbi:hypothetical protein Tco_1292766 [Tanacetum coccineum]